MATILPENEEKALGIEKFHKKKKKGKKGTIQKYCDLLVFNSEKVVLESSSGKT